MDNKKPILQSLSDPPVALTAGEIRIRLRAKSVKLQEYQILQELRDLQSKDIVRFESGRWSAIGLEKSKISVVDEKTVSFVPDKTCVASSPQEQGSKHWSPGKSSILNSAVNKKEDVEQNIPKKEYSGPWGKFRKLLNYYADCVRNEEGAEASAYLTDFEKRFIYLNQFGFWYPKIGNRWALKIPIVFLKNFVNNPVLFKDESVLTLGYPIQIWNSNDKETPFSFIKPIFTFQLSFQRNTDYFEIICEDPWPEVNLGWLEYAIKKPEDQRGFLAACGLIIRSSSGECFNEGIHYTVNPEFPTLANVLTSFFGERIREPLRPESVSSLRLPENVTNGIYNKAVLMLGNRTRYSKTLLKELNQITKVSDDQLEQTALKYIFKDDVQPRTENSESPHEGIVLETAELNCEQRQAVGSLLKHDISVITGPPGTGKSQVVAAAMVNNRLKDRTVIFTSRNHKAIDAVVSRLAGEEDGPLVIRGNSKEDPFLNIGFEETIGRLLSEQYDSDAQEKWKVIAPEIDQLLLQRGELAKKANEIQELRDKIGEIEQKIVEATAPLEKKFIDDLNVSLDKYPIKLVRKLADNFIDFTNIRRKLGFLEEIFWKVKILSFMGEITILNASLKNISPFFKFPQMKFSVLWLREFSGILHNLLRAANFCQFRKQEIPLENKLKTLPHFEEVVKQINVITDRLRIIIPQAIRLDLKRRAGLPPDADRESFAALRSSLRGLDHLVADDEDRFAAKEALEEYSPVLLKHFPVWAITNLAVGSRLPLVPGLFDLAVIDEASQCDIPSAIPILFRSQRVGVVGDPCQLSHVTKIKGSKDVLLRKRHGLTQVNNEQRFAFPDTSLYDLFSQTNGVSPILLRDTYRSVDDIAAYSNDLFYKGSLRVMTLSEKLNIPKNMKPGIHWTEIQSEIRSAGPHGCIAPQEVERILEILKKLLVQDGFAGTVGVVTPFHQQKIRLMDRITAEIPYEARARVNLIIDTSHGFQGDERDVIIMSLCAGSGMPPGSLGFIRQNPNLMNVAVSRARAVFHIVGNRSWVDSCGIPHLQRLISSTARLNRKEILGPFSPHESPWEKVLYEALKEKRIWTEPQYPTLGRRLDLALVRNDKKIDIEVDGDAFHRNPDGSRKRDDVWRDIQLQAADWKVMRFWVYELREDLPSCVNRILKEWSG